MKNVEETMTLIEFRCRAKKFDDKGTWKANDDGTVNTDGPRVMVGEEAIMSGQFVTKYVVHVSARRSM